LESNSIFNWKICLNIRRWWTLYCQIWTGGIFLLQYNTFSLTFAQCHSRLPDPCVSDHKWR
jgi:hypothetical protein